MHDGTPNLLRLNQKIPLTQDERAALDDGLNTLEAPCTRLADVPPPGRPNAANSP